MRRSSNIGPARWGAMAVAALVTGTGCATSGDVDEAMDEVREDLITEMEERDQALEDRLSSRIDDVEQENQAQIQQLEQQLAELRDDFDVAVEQFEEAVRFNSPVHFGFDEATIRSEDQPVLDRFADVVTAYYEDALITVEGFTDPAGPAAYNNRLGQERAEAVMEYLADQGVPEDRMRAVSYGEDQERQVAPGEQGPDNGWRNRRAAMVIDFNEEQANEPVADGGR